MALDIGLSPINSRVVAKLLGANALAFAVVLAVFCGGVYAFAFTTSQAHIREKLIVFAGSVVGSIDSGETEPDLIRSADIAPVSLTDKKLQWFSPEGKLLLERGDLQAHVSFNSSGGFQLQQDPHAILFTRQAVVNGKMLGYVRAAQSLALVDSELESLQYGLLIGALSAIGVSGLGIWWLTSLALKPIEQSFLQLKQFTDDASHELRNPIMAIRSNCSLVIRHAQELKEEHRQRVAHAIDATDQLVQLADDLLLLARADGNAAVESREQLNMSALLEELVKNFRARAEDKEVTIAQNVTAGLRISGDRAQLCRAFSNLLDNAICYTPKGGSIRIEFYPDREQLVFRISDTGIGISNEDLPKVFNRFWRADGARSVRSGGTGLGLSIAKSIIAQHGGRITVISKPRVGTTFTVTFPYPSTR